MDYGLLLGALHQFVEWLLYPVLAALIVALVALLWELGLALAERGYTLAAYRRANAGTKAFSDYAERRLERSELLARSGPILGLMGTLIPLGPGLAALGNGQLDILSTALIIAFDTTVVGLLIGLLGFIISKLRRRWYTALWQDLSSQAPAEDE